MKREKIVIDLTNKDLNEGLYTQFALNMRRLLYDMYLAGFDAPLSLKGTQEQIDAFFRALKIGGARQHRTGQPPRPRRW